MADRKKDRKKQSGPPGLGLLGGSKKNPKEKEGTIIIMVGEDGEMLDQPMFEKRSKGGRAGYSVGGKAIKGVSKILLKK
jgi:hypothetical protein